MMAHRHEDGAVAIVTAILLVALLIVAAFVVDLGLLRVDRSDNQVVVDSAASASAVAMRGGATPEEACEQAWAYLVENIPEIPQNEPSDCSAIFGGYSCSAGDPPRVAEMQVGGYLIRIISPVPDGHVLMGTQADDPNFDGTDPCHRMGVEVTHDRTLTIGGAVTGSSEGTTTVSSVGRYSPPTEGNVISSLVVLDPTHCQVLETRDNGSAVLVGKDPVAGKHGIITVDSDASACGFGPNDYVIRAGGNGARVCAGLNNLAAMIAGTSDTCDSEPDTLFTPAESSGRSVSTADDPKVSPDIVVGTEVTRRPIDHRYNCKGSYPQASSSGQNWDQHYGSVVPCPANQFLGTNRQRPDRNHMDQLGLHFAPGTDPSMWIDSGSWEEHSGADCDIGGSTVTWPDDPANEHLFLDCDVTVANAGTLNLDTAGYIVVTGDINIGGVLNVNADRSSDVVLIIHGRSNQDNALAGGTQSDIELARTFLYLHDGGLDIRNNLFLWDAPIDTGYDPDTRDYVNCILTPVGPQQVPSPECFEDLGLWSNWGGQHFMTGGGGLDIEGIFFAPNSGLVSNGWEMRGGTNQILNGAQFFSYRFDISGGSRIGLIPDPARNEPVNPPFLGLIR